MSLFVFDTDVLSLYQQGNPAVLAEIAAHQVTELATTVISVEEQISGWYRLLRRAKNSPQVAFAYSRLAESVESLSKLRILRFSERAIERFEHLKSLKTKVRAPDLRIAAIALENSAVLVTRNMRDFRLMPQLQIEDWSLPKK